MATILLPTIRHLAGQVLDFALPPRCAGCGDIIDEVDGFCASCWLTLDFLGDNGCQRCGLPLEATAAEMCGRCLAAPPPLDRMRAAVAYCDLSRGITLKLKYGRKIALARTMARFMAPLRGPGADALLIPVPLHRRRIRPTPPLKGLNAAQRHSAVRGAFTTAQGRRIDGRTVILIDDVLTTGSTAAACAKALRKAGAERIELISWARVVRPTLLMR